MKYLFLSSLIFAFTSVFGQCLVSNLTVNIGANDCLTDTYQVTGNVSFTSPPATGTLNIELNNGITIYDTIINAPFSGSYAWSISNIPSDGSNITITAYFTDNPGCSLSVNSTAPVSCQCTASVGTVDVNITGSGTNNYVLCYGDQINLSSNQDFIAPADQNIGGITYDPGIAYLAYECLPYISPPQYIWDNMGLPLDSCLLGIVSFNDTVIDVNNFGQPSYAGNFSNNTIYYVPITMYSMVDGINAVSISGNYYCYDMGTPIAVTYLSDISLTEVVDSINGEVTVTVSGGYPEFFTGQYQITNSGAGMLSSATVDSSGGSFVISGLTGGSTWDYTVTDGNGSSKNQSGIMTGDLGIIDYQLDFLISPVPAHDYLYMEFPESLNGNMTILNQLGEIVLTKNISDKAVKLNVSNFNSGVYFIRILNKRGQISVNRFVKD